MSSYISSQYSIERQRRRAIVQQCNQELQQATRAAADNRAQWKAMLEERARKQAELRIQEKRAADEAAAQTLRVQAQRKSCDAQVRRMLETAAENVAACEKLGNSADLRERLRTMQEGFSMFGASGELQRQIEHFITEEIPARRQQLVQETEKAREQKDLKESMAAHANLKDQSTKFVSMQTDVSDERTRYTSPWNRFVQRLQALSAGQQPLGDTRSQELLEKAQQLPASHRNRFILQNETTVRQMERELAEMETLQDTGAEWHSHLWDQYLALCMLCDVQPALTEDASEIQLEHENETLFARYQTEKERQYVTNTFSQVLDSFGITFEAMETDGFGQLQMKYHISEQAQLQITRSDAGAFEMQFSGTSADEVASTDEKRQVVEQAHAFCQKLPQVAKALQERGIVFEQVAVQQPTEENVKIVHRREQNKVWKAANMREMK